MIRISDHAKKHMSACNIAESDVLNLMNGNIEPIKVEPSKIDCDCIEIKAVLSCQLCKVIFSISTNTIVTAYKIRR